MIIFLGLFEYALESIFEGMEGDHKDRERFLAGKGLEAMISKHTPVLFKSKIRTK